MVSPQAVLLKGVFLYGIVQFAGLPPTRGTTEHFLLTWVCLIFCLWRSSGTCYGLPLGRSRDRSLC